MGEYYNDFRNCQTLEDLKAKLNRFFESFFSEIDSLNVTSLNTNATKISSENGETYIQGPLILMHDNNGALRRKIGYDADSTAFKDEWYDPDGVLTAYVDSTGKLVVNEGLFKGNIITQKNAYVGDSIYLGDLTQKGKKIAFYNNSGVLCEIEFTSAGLMKIYNSEGIQIDAGISYMDLTAAEDISITTTGGGVNIIATNDIDFTSGGSVTISSEPIATESYVTSRGYATESYVTSRGYITGTGVNGSFTSLDGKTVIVSNGRITSIA